MRTANQNLENVFRRFSRQVEPKIIQVLNSFVDKKFKNVIRYQISTGGKRIRPVLAIISCKAVGGKIKDVLYAAAALEILHNYTLIIDDIIDHSVLRRGKKTFWAKFGKSIAECAGIDYSAAVFQAAFLSKKEKEVGRIFAKTMKTIVEGEILDILFERKGREEEPYIVKHRPSKISIKDYLEMISKKTAVLFEASCQIGAIVGEATKEEILSLKNYGFNLGMAFQIQDDILDIFGKKEVFGKKIGKDIEERKLGNIVILLALKELKQREKDKLLFILKKQNLKKEDIKKAINLIQKTKAKEVAKEMGVMFAKKAQKFLRKLPSNKYTNILYQIAEFVVKREL